VFAAGSRLPTRATGGIRARSALWISANTEAVQADMRHHVDVFLSRVTHRQGVAAACATWIALAAALTVSLSLDARTGGLGRDDLLDPMPIVWVLVAAVASAAVVGAALVSSTPRHPVGWLFLALALSMMGAGVIESYATYGAVARPGSLPGADVLAAVSQSTFVPWLVIIALVLQLTPTGAALTPTWGRIARGTAWAGVVYFIAGLARARPLDWPYQDVRNPMTIEVLAQPAAIASETAILMVGIGLILSGISMVLRFRRSRGDERAQLLWLALVVVPLPAFVVIAFAASMSGRATATVIATGGLVVLVPVAAGLSIARYRLYGVERIVSRTISYVLLSVTLVAVYTVVVLAASRGVGDVASSPEVSATLGAVTAACLALPMRAVLQDLIDRRFNRRRHDAIRMVRAATQSGWADDDVERLLGRAVDDGTLRITYWLEDRRQWVAADGNPREPTEPSVAMTRGSRVIARIAYDADAVDPDVVQMAGAEAIVELDNVRLRAELEYQLAEVARSRARLGDAQQAERQRIERDLHDGAQQRLLALALSLQAASLNGDPARLRTAAGDAVLQARAAVRELRELANGLHPVVLSDGGLAAALDDLARRSSIPATVTADVPRLAPIIEYTAWLIACEAVANAQKHAGAKSVQVAARCEGRWLAMVIRDDGSGGADSGGAGLRGLQDRAEAAGGTLTVASPDGGGTRIEVGLPCAS
jgi:signal transduction histidine kinase